MEGEKEGFLLQCESLTTLCPWPIDVYLSAYIASYFISFSFCDAYLTNEIVRYSKCKI